MSEPVAARSSQSEFFPIRGLRTHLRHWPGSSQPLRLILHGWNDTSATWQRVVDHLPPDWDIAAPDWRGFGLSEWAGDTYLFVDYIADLDGLLQALDAHSGHTTQVDLIGHSMGGQIAAMYAGLRPERVRKLVILDALFLPETPATKAPQRLRQWLDDIPDPGREKRYPSLQALAERVQRYHAGLDAAGALQVAAAWSAREPDGQFRLLADPRHRQRGPTLYRDAEAQAVLEGIQAPCLILDAGRSALRQACPAELRARRIAAIRNSSVACLEHSGHMLHFDAPAETAHALQGFLSTS